MMTKIFVTFQQEGVHCWAGAPDKFDYLRALHRHMFHVRIECFVSHSDRDIEMIDFKHKATEQFMLSNLEHHLANGMPFFGSKSCEMMAENVRLALVSIGYNVPQVEVSEDGENGAIVYA